MQFLANENFPGTAVATLVASGHDVAWVRSTAPGMSDEDVLAWAIRENRILLTFDKDFGELASRRELPDSCGIVLFRTPMPRASEAGTRLAAIVTAREDWPGHFSVIEPSRLRMRRLPSVGKAHKP
jgi:predicted nuclease of predicted toxin-antitoxin system